MQEEGGSDQIMRLMDPEPHICGLGYSNLLVFGPKIGQPKISALLGLDRVFHVPFLDFIIFIEFRLGIILYYYLD